MRLVEYREKEYTKNLRMELFEDSVFILAGYTGRFKMIVDKYGNYV
jgi:hypothetical protein